MLQQGITSARLQCPLAPRGGRSSKQRRHPLKSHCTGASTVLLLTSSCIPHPYAQLTGLQTGASRPARPGPAAHGPGGLRVAGRVPCPTCNQRQILLLPIRALSDDTILRSWNSSKKESHKKPSWGPNNASHSKNYLNSLDLLEHNTYDNIRSFSTQNICFV